MTENKLHAALILGASFCLGIFFSLPAAAKLYKWVDEKGTTHYGETIPPEYADKERVELNQAGRVVKKQEAPVPGELNAKRGKKEQEDARKRNEDQATLEMKRHDRALVETYSNANEIDLARKRNLQQIESRIAGVNASLKMASDSLLGLQKEADAYTQGNKAIPESLQEDQREAQARFDKLQKDLGKVEAEKAAMDARYDADKARFKELTGR
jgi:hypothetical protein